MIRSVRVVGLLLLGLTLGVCERANADVIDFESFTEFTDVGGLIPGVTFSNAIVLTAGTSVNEFEFPPHSGTNVVYDGGNGIRIDFASAVTSFGAYLTYLVPVTLTAYDQANNLLGTVTSDFGANFVTSGNSPNELFQLSSVGISYVILQGSSLGGSFVVDDVHYDTQPVPEPAAMSLLILGMATVFRRRLFTPSVQR